MTKNNFFMFLFVISVGLLGLRMMTAITPTTKKLAVPVAEKSYRLSDLSNLITTNSKLAQFLVPVYRQNAVRDKDCWQTNDKQMITNVDGSQSAGSAGVQQLILDNLDQMVTLHNDNILITHLVKDKRLNAQTQNSYSKILLYFVLDGYRFYIADPYPGRIIPRRVNPAQINLNKWNLSATF